MLRIFVVSWVWGVALSGVRAAASVVLFICVGSRTRSVRGIGGSLGPCFCSAYRVRGGGLLVRVGTRGASIPSLRPTAGVLRGGSSRRGSFLIVHVSASVLHVRLQKFSCAHA